MWLDDLNKSIPATKQQNIENDEYMELISGIRTSQVTRIIDNRKSALIKEGYLKCRKPGKVVSAWKDYWTILDTGDLFQFRSPKDVMRNQVRKTISLSAFFIRQVENNGQRCFELYNVNKSYLFTHDDMDPLLTWINAITPHTKMRNEEFATLPRSTPPPKNSSADLIDFGNDDDDNSHNFARNASFAHQSDWNLRSGRNTIRVRESLSKHLKSSHTRRRSKSFDGSNK